MTKNRFEGEEDSDYIRDNKTDERALYLCDWLDKLNNLSDENEQLKNINGIHRSALLDSEYDIKKLEKDNEELKKENYMLASRNQELKINNELYDAENEQLKIKNKGLQSELQIFKEDVENSNSTINHLTDENEQLKKENKHLQYTIESNSQNDYIDFLEKQNERLKERITELATNDKIVFMNG